MDGWVYFLFELCSINNWNPTKSTSSHTLLLFVLCQKRFDVVVPQVRTLRSTAQCKVPPESVLPVKVDFTKVRPANPLVNDAHPATTRTVPNTLSSFCFSIQGNSSIVPYECTFVILTSLQLTRRRTRPANLPQTGSVDVKTVTIVTALK